jgi:imidazolonepropionase-like amidohydrolase
LKRIICLTLVYTFAVGFISLRPSPSLGEIEKDNFEAQQAYRDYGEAWKLKDIAAVENVISGDSVQPPNAAEPTFLIFKYQHPVGKEFDDCSRVPTGTECHSHFQLDFTGSSISLDSVIRTDAGLQPVSYRARGQNSTRSFIDLDIEVAADQINIVENGSRRTIPAPKSYFTLQQDAPFITQELLITYWRAHHNANPIPLLPAGEVHIRQRGTSSILNGEKLTRYSVHGVTWGDETVWLNERGEIAAAVGADAEEDRIEVIRPRYESALKDFAEQAAGDAVIDLEDVSRKLNPVAAGTFALVHANVINVADGGSFQPDVIVLISKGKVTAVGKQVPLAGVKVIDVRGKFVLPGLWDTHAHFEQWEWGPAYLVAGVTTVRDVGNEIEFLVPIRNSLNAGRGLGPQMHAAGLIDSDPGSLTSEHAEDAKTARAIVRSYHELGYEQIKIYQSLRPELIPVVADEAHRMGMTVTGHIPTGTDALAAVREGMDQINHIGFVTRVMRPQGASAVQVDSPEAQAAVRLLLEHHTVVEPTLARGEFNGHARRVPFNKFEPSVASLPPELAVILDNAGVAEQSEARTSAALQTALNVTKILHDAGVPILAGSDQVVPGFSMHRELELLVRSGLSPTEALQCAITVPAEILSAPDRGMVQTGKRADLIVVDANPLENISNIRGVYLTVVGGRAYDPNQLRRIVDIKPSTRAAETP